MFLGIDVGTGSLKAVLGSERGLQTITETYPESMSRSGIPDSVIFSGSVDRFISKIARFSRDSGEKITGMSLCGHGPSVLVIDRAGRIISDIITWQNSDAAKEAAMLSDYFDGFSKDGTCYEAKILKMLKVDPELLSRGSKVLYPKDYLLFLLTGRIIMDFSTAATLVFFNPEDCSFQTGETGIPVEIFPEVVDSWEIAGVTGTDYSRSLGLADGIPVAAGGIDAWCEALGAGAIEEGMIVDGTGTSTCITCCRNEGESPLYHVIPGKSLSIETMSATGDSIRWVKEVLDGDFDEFMLDGKAAPVPVIFQPYLNGERSPVWDERACLSMTGLTGHSGRSDIVKGVLQGIALGTRQCIELSAGGVFGYGQLEKIRGKSSGVRAVGGGAGNPAFLQYKADITGLEYLEMKEKDAAPLGAMMLAAKSLGEDLEKFASRWIVVNNIIKPDSRFRDLWEELYSIYGGYYNQLRETEHRLYNVSKAMQKML